MTERQRHYLLTLLLPGVGHRTVVSRLNNGQEIVSIIGELVSDTSDIVQLWDKVGVYDDLAQKHGYDFVTWEDEIYPQVLREIPDPPVGFFVKGMLPAMNMHIAVVGSRIMTQYGSSVAQDLCRSLSDAGCVIVSGFMRGIDTIAHTTALKHNAPTIAVLGSGFLNPVPPENIPMIDKIAKSGGAIISEFLPDQPATKYTFPLRNRIVAGLCCAVIVVEAGAKSGALITARLAAEQGKTVFAVPGSLYSTQSAGSHWLIQQGAEVVLSTDTVIERLGISKTSSAVVPAFETPLEEELYTHVRKQQLHINEMVLLTKHPTHQVLATVTTLELRGILKNIGNDTYVVQ